MKNFLKIIKENKWKYQCFVVCYICFALVFALIGSTTGLWSSYIKYFPLYFTYQSIFITLIFYLLLTIYQKKKYQKLRFIENKNIKNAVGTYILFMFFTVLFFFLPMELLQIVGIGPGAIPDYLGPNDTIISGEIINTLSVHLVIPLLIIFDLLTTEKHEKIDDKRKRKQEKINKYLLFSCYPIFYLGIIFIVGAFINIYPYTIFDASFFSYNFLIAIFIFYLVILYTLAFFAVDNKFKIILRKDNKIF